MLEKAATCWKRCAPPSWPSWTDRRWTSVSWLGEQLQATADELAELFRHERVIADLNAAEFTALRAATAAARTAGGGDVQLIATAAHRRGQEQPAEQ
ncbi:hypothetical protein [Micromonospora sp. CB01531]|uniref:hypothetical protein n=1 Tax=Micromonospora sp. CB01531 TaxID=1718947 RepID=UPI00093E2AA0|nr:hypothetical protein [Micromonospora sp. CB01531]OKI44030.1 hypothetical protein A6A27_38585 [Micromonospora sp. CB01531]